MLLKKCRVVDRPLGQIQRQQTPAGLERAGHALEPRVAPFEVMLFSKRIAVFAVGFSKL